MPALPVALRDAARALRRSPLFAAMAVLSLALALALNTTMFGLVDATVRPRLPFDADRIYAVEIRGGPKRWATTFEDRVAAVRGSARAVDALTHFSWSFEPVQAGTGPYGDERIAYVPADFLPTLGVRPHVGRLTAPGEENTAVVSFVAWRRMFGGRPLSDTLTFHVGNARYTVVGVLPRGMHFPHTDLWVARPHGRPDVRGTMTYDGRTIVVRARPGATQDHVQADLDVAAARLTRDFGTAELRYALMARPARGDPARLSDLHRLLAAAVAVVLLVACANLATLMLARGVARRREVALRMALGATRGHVMRAVLAESGMLALGGALLGVLLTVWALYLLSTHGVRVVPALGDVEPVPSWRVFSFMLGAAVLATVLCAALPAVRMAQTDPAGPLGDGSGTTTARARERHGLLVVAQVALSMSLLLGTGFLVHTTLRMRGFARQVDARRLVIGDVWLSERMVPTGLLAERFWADAVARARALPGVEDAAWRRGAGPKGGIVLAEQGAAGEAWVNLRGYYVVSPSYLRTLGLPVVQGRDFAPGDQAGTGAVIVDEDAAKRLWPDLKSPVGRMLKLGARDTQAPRVRVVGVARRMAYQFRATPGIPPEPVIYHLAARDSSRDRELVVRGRPGDTALPILLRRQLEAATSTRSWARARPWLADYDDAMGFYAYLAGLFGAFGAFALALSAVGLYGVLGYMVGRRRREFAVRVALGATAGNVARIVVRQATVLTLAGVGLGALAALFALLAWVDLVFQAQWTMVVVLVGAEAVVFAVAGAASAGPVRRAARANPMDVMRAT